MKCDRFMGLFLGLDNGEALSLRMRMHLRRCGQCRTETGIMREVEQELRSLTGPPMERDMSEAVMSGIMKDGIAYGRHVPFYNWIGAGVMIFASILLVTMSDSLALLKAEHGGNLEVPLSIVLGLAITAYVTIFAGTHLEDFGRWLRQHK